MIGGIPGFAGLAWMFIGISFGVPFLLVAETGRWWSPLPGAILLLLIWQWVWGEISGALMLLLWSAVPVLIVTLTALGVRDRATGLLQGRNRAWAWGFFALSVAAFLGGDLFTRLVR